MKSAAPGANARPRLERIFSVFAKTLQRFYAAVSWVNIEDKLPV
jgi:hypothetical protein